MQGSGQAYLFGSFVVDTREGLLMCEGRPIALTPKAFEVLVALVENSGRCLGKDELMKRVWPDSFVEENNLAQNISLVRRALQVQGEAAAEFIETVPRRGYRFRAPVTVREGEIVIREKTRTRVVIEEDDGDDSVNTGNSVSEKLMRSGGGPAVNAEFPPELMRIPETKYAQSGDVNIAYQTLGDAPLDLVFVMGWVSHLEYFWKEPRFARFLRRLASFSRLILFDKRGTGLSDRVPLNELPTLEQRMDDVRAVLDAVGSERAALCGVSEGGPMSALFAATYPEKTDALVMIGTYAKRVRDDDYPWAPTIEEREKFFDHMREHWGGPVGIEERAPTAANDPQFRDWWAEYLRMGASPGAALALTKMNADIDVRQVLPTVHVPTLVIHRVGDECLKVEEGRYVAAAIPGARYVELPGEDHLPFVGDQDAILDEVEEFLTGVRHTLEPETVLATVLFLSIAETPADVLARFRVHVKKEIEWFRGREVELTDRSVLVTFDGPARAIRAACAIREYAMRLSVETRAGLHTGECDLINGGQVGGLAVEIGRSVRESAAAGEVLATSTVRDLVAGSGISFIEHGALNHASAGEWRLFRVDRGGCG